MVVVGVRSRRVVAVALSALLISTILFAVSMANAPRADAAGAVSGPPLAPWLSCPANSLCFYNLDVAPTMWSYPHPSKNAIACKVLPTLRNATDYIINNTNFEAKVVVAKSSDCNRKNVIRIGTIYANSRGWMNTDYRNNIDWVWFIK
jgi:hypothetical protein